ncbi:HypC/HybG/HupF family hydrogenase formation chaperone [Halioxenophilus aromaticivorans]|uniref:HypC/HybG/HupF family hydrogenase formation chaperone n=1 Tax=Halioxenophilus aromaticivorans TaxID=1306992 RepID=A0AAV3U9D0_9ALTE
MCLAIPAEVISIDRDTDNASVAVGEVKKTVSLALVEDVNPGDFVLIHVGYALEKLDPEEAEKTLAIFAEMDAEMAPETTTVEGDRA